MNIYRTDDDTLARVEEAGLNASAAPQQRLVDGWLVRFSAGKAKRARCVNPIASGRLPLARKLALCQQVYDELQLPMLIRITPFSQPPGLDDALACLGMPRMDETCVMVCTDLREGRAPLPEGVEVLPAGAEQLAQTVGAWRGSPLSQRQAHGLRLANSPVPWSAWLLKAQGQLVACGQFALEGDLVGLYDVFTAPAARNLGYAGALCRHLLVEAAARGAGLAYLQVEADNHPARAVYRRLGFRDAYAYHYRTPPPAVA
jgi:ribosomal protein S18 acetylase RimI-like enzyme